jgi:DNA repair protein RadC
MKSATSVYAVSDTDLVTNTWDREYVLRFRDIPDDQKPREKLLKDGPTVLSSAELLAIIIGTGTKKEDVMSLVNRIIKEYGEKNIANQHKALQLAAELHIPALKAMQIVACFELGRRFFQTNHRIATLRTAKQAFVYLRDMCDLPKEHLRGIYLNSRYRVIHDEIISIGTLTANIVHPREVFRPAIEYSAAAILVAHNHPSGDPTPNSADIEITRQLVIAGKIVGVELLDHLVIGKHKFVSLMDEKFHVRD